jgi:hypothetical protein
MACLILSMAIPSGIMRIKLALISLQTCRISQSDPSTCRHVVAARRRRTLPARSALVPVASSEATSRPQQRRWESAGPYRCIAQADIHRACPRDGSRHSPPDQTLGADRDWHSTPSDRAPPAARSRCTCCSARPPGQCIWTSSLRSKLAPQMGGHPPGIWKQSPPER